MEPLQYWNKLEIISTSHINRLWVLLRLITDEWQEWSLMSQPNLSNDYQVNALETALGITSRATCFYLQYFEQLICDGTEKLCYKVSKTDDDQSALLLRDMIS